MGQVVQSFEAAEDRSEEFVEKCDIAKTQECTELDSEAVPWSQDEGTVVQVSAWEQLGVH